MGRIGLLVATTLIAVSFGAQQIYAQSGNSPDQKAEKADKQKSTEKKDAAKQGGTQADGGKAAPMSGFRPDPQSNY